MNTTNRVQITIPKRTRNYTLTDEDKRKREIKIRAEEKMAEIEERRIEREALEVGL